MVVLVRRMLTLYLLMVAVTLGVRAEGEPERDKRLCEIDSENQAVQMKLPKLNKPVFVSFEMRPSDATAGNLHDGTQMFRGTTADSEGWFINERGQFRHVVIDPADNEVVFLHMRSPFNNESCKVSDIPTFIKEQSGRYVIWRKFINQPIDPLNPVPLGPVGAFFLDVPVQPLPDKKIVRGLPATGFTFCKYIKPLEGEVNPHPITTKLSFYYWTAPEFPARNFTPVQVVVESSMYLGLGDFVSYYYTTEFLFYTTRLNIDAFYRVPYPYMCPGRKVDRDFVDPPNMFSYYMEDATRTLVDDGGFLVYQSERYDFKNNRSAQGFIDHTVKWTQPLFFSKNSIVNVHDFKQGVAYTVDQRYGNCSYKSLSADSIGDVGPGSRPNSVKMLDPKSYFKGNSKWYFSGEGYYRGRFGYRWTTQRRWPKPDDPNGLPAIIEWFMAVASTTTDGTTLDEIVPAAEVTTVGSAAGVTVTKQDVFGYSRKMPRLPDFSACYSNNEQRSFVLKLRDDYGAVIKYKHVLMSNVEAAIANFAGISATRVVNLQVEDSNGVYVTFSILKEPQNPAITDENPLPLGEAVSKLTRSIADGRFKVKGISDKNPFYGVDMYVDSSSYFELQRRVPYDWFAGYSGGAFAGVFVGTMLFGLVIGGVGAHFFYRS